ncbi:glucose-6-phosphate 1-dehydrogenase [Nematocida sp. LUAm3]|nr:glucose-6-phosphate 1-dehydrogenase [Nematocida sp. LUAm3]KAI5173920.1 glucose-6-phosphate 1-dehydrogenase [Nematocida sp. LUAm2]KAI5177335.1 glucose-6-phosphate 1-dehydrogenase [Nematocida sp. LUAm1]
MLIILGSTGDLCKKKIFPGINEMFRAKLGKYARTQYADEQLDMTSGSLSSSMTSMDLQKSPITDAYPKSIRNKTQYLQAQGKDILSKELGQRDLLKNAGIRIPQIIGYARSILTTEELIRKIDPSIEFLEETVHAIKYVHGSYEEFLKKVEPFIKEEENPIYIYMAVPPEVYPVIIDQVKETTKNIVLLAEKPIGFGLETFHQLKEKASALKNFLSVDHYLFKNILLQMPEIRSTSFLGSIIAPGMVKKISARFHEKIGVESRVGYFNSAGICRDVIQNHMLLSLAIVLNGNDKLSVLKKIHSMVLEKTTTGVYTGYVEKLKEETQALPKETFMKTETYIDAPWNVPLIIEGGKKMKNHFVGVILYLSKEGVKKLWELDTGSKMYVNKKKMQKYQPEDVQGKIIVFITPKESINLSLWKGKSLIKRVYIPVKRAKDGMTPYHALFSQLLYENKIDQNFSQLDELEEQWRIVDKVLDDNSKEKITY